MSRCHHERGAVADEYAFVGKQYSALSQAKRNILTLLEML